MSPTERDRLYHMLEAALDAVSFTSGASRQDLDSSPLLRRALVNCIEEIGEAAAHVSPATRLRLSTIPWREVRAMRNFLAHAYFTINLDILWETVTRDIPPLAEALSAELAPEADPTGPDSSKPQEDDPHGNR